MIAGVGWDGPAEASFIVPAFTCTVLTLTGFIGSDEPGTVPIGWVWITPAVSGAGSIFGSALCSILGWAGGTAAVAWASAAVTFAAGGVRMAGGVQLSGDTAASCCATGAGPAAAPLRRPRPEHRRHCAR